MPFCPPKAGSGLGGQKGTDIGLRRTATANALYEDHSNELRSLELQRRRQEIEDEREERRLKRRKIDLEKSEA